MRTRAAVLTAVGEKWVVDEVELADPGPFDVLVEMKAAGLCHSDEHMVTGDMVIPEERRRQRGLPSQFPLVGGHEGAGVVIATGSRVNPRLAIPQLLARYEAGTLKLDELITRRYALEEINTGYDDQRAGRILRGVITF